MFEYLLIGFASFINILLGIIILSRAKEISWYKISFGLSSVFVGLWGVATIFLNYNTNMFWERLLFTFSISAVYFIVIFSYEYIEGKYNPIIYFATFQYVLLSFLILFSDLIIYHVAKAPTGGIEVYFGPLMPLFSIYMVLILLVLISNLYVGYREAKPLEKLQLKYMIFGILIFVFPALLTNLFLPILGVYDYNNLGVIFSIFFTGFVSIAIIKHRLFSVRTIVLKITQIFIIAVMLMFIILLERYLKLYVLGFETNQLEGLILDFITVFIVAALLQEVYRVSGEQIAKLLNSEVLKLDQLIKELDSKIGSKLEGDTVMTAVINILENGFSNTRFYFYENQDFVGFKLFPEKDLSHEVKIFVHNTKETYIFQEDVKHSGRWKSSKKAGITIVIPLSENYKLVAFKTAEEVYSKNELDTLEKIIPKLRDIFARVEVFERSQHFNKVLSRKVDEATKDLNKKNLALQQLRAKERDMLDIMGHELRTPLSIIKMKQSLLRKKASEHPAEFNAKTFLKEDDAIKNAIGREVELLETMLSSTKIDAGRMEMVLEKVKISEVIESSYDVHHQQAVAKGLEFRIDGYNERVFVYADKVRLAEILDNFVSNAVKYTNSGSVVISVEDQIEMISITIKDTGIGISKKGLLRLGEKFFRVGQYIDSPEGEYGEGKIVRPGGTGLGLYVAFQLIGMMGGSYKVDSEEGVGTSFTFTVPKYVGQKARQNDELEKNVFERIGLKDRDRENS